MESRVYLIRPDNFTQEVLLEIKPVLLVCMAQDDSYARQMKALQNVALGYENKLKVGLLAQDSTEIFKKRLQISGTPTFLLLQGGKEISRILGVTDQEALTRLIDQHLSLDPGEA